MHMTQKVYFASTTRHLATAALAAAAAVTVLTVCWP